MNLFLLIFFFSYLAHGETLHYRPSMASTAEPGIHFQLPYSLGTVLGEVLIIGGKVTIDTENAALSNGTFKVPIDSLYTNKPMRDCHLREALGINYEESDFPKTHVCSEKFQIPFEGKNAIAYPLITLKILSLKNKEANNKKISMDHETKVEVSGEWTIHGKTLPSIFELKILPTPNSKSIKILGETIFSLKAFGIIVRPAKILLFPIKTEDQVRVSFNVPLDLETDELK